MNPIHFTPKWQAIFSGGHIGLLALGPVDNTPHPTLLDSYKAELETRLRAQFSQLTRADLQQRPLLHTYKQYYRRFKKTYHVQLQLESVVFKGKSLPRVNPLVDACFAAELETRLLTASHDLDTLIWPVTIDAAAGTELLTRFNGRPKQIKANDMMMTDAKSVVCTIIYGQDQRTAVTAVTRNVLYVTYAPPGIPRDAVAHHQSVLLRNVQRVAPDVDVKANQIVTAVT